jgi:hypothetical protein
MLREIESGSRALLGACRNSGAHAWTLLGASLFAPV